MLGVGIASDFVIDYFLSQPTGATKLILWPFLDLTVDYLGVYRSSDRGPAVVTTTVIGIVLGIDRFVIAGQSRHRRDVSRRSGRSGRWLEPRDESVEIRIETADRIDTPRVTAVDRHRIGEAEIVVSVPPVYVDRS